MALKGNSKSACAPAAGDTERVRYVLSMLNERRATSFSYDQATDVAAITFEGEVGSSGEVSATLLLDASGFLVGLDLRAEPRVGVVVMLGPHEKVARTTELAVKVDGNALRISGASRAVRGAEKNPYV